MLLAFDIGNTHIVAGLLDSEGNPLLTFRIASNEKLTEDELFSYLRNIAQFNEINLKDVNPAIYPTEKEMKRVNFNPIFLSYYNPWSGYKNMEFARTRGFKTLDDTGEWKRDGYIEQYDQIDTLGYLTHTWFKFPKLGHQRVT